MVPCSGLRALDPALPGGMHECGPRLNRITKDPDRVQPLP